MLWESLEIVQLLREIKFQLVLNNKLLHKLVDEEAIYILKIIWKGPNTIMASDVQLNIAPPYGNNVGVPAESKNGQPFTYDPTKIVWAVQDPSVVSGVQNPDGSMTFTPLKVGSTGVAVQDSSTGASETGTITVIQSADTFSMTITWKAAS